MTTIQTNSITITDRLREDLGELGDLMASIQQYGLLHPIVVDDKRRLVAGQRRLEAVKRLGKKRIEVKFYGELTDEERQTLELEENVRRKNLTAYEASKFTKEHKKQAAKELEEEFSEESSENSTSPKVGRPRKPDSKDAVAQRVGKARPTIREAEEHVYAGEKYPFLRHALWSQKAALEMAKMLDEVGEKDVEYLYQFCRNGTGGEPKQIRAFFETWHAASASTRRKLRQRLDGDRHRSSRTVSIMGKCAPRPDPALVWVYGAVRELKSLVKKRPEGDGLLPTLKRCLKSLEQFHTDAQVHNKESIEMLIKELLS